MSSGKSGESGHQQGEQSTSSSDDDPLVPGTLPSVHSVKTVTQGNNPLYVSLTSNIPNTAEAVRILVRMLKLPFSLFASSMFSEELVLHHFCLSSDLLQKSNDGSITYGEKLKMTQAAFQLEWAAEIFEDYHNATVSPFQVNVTNLLQNQTVLHREIISCTQASPEQNDARCDVVLCEVKATTKKATSLKGLVLNGIVLIGNVEAAQKNEEEDMKYMFAKEALDSYLTNGDGRSSHLPVNMLNLCTLINQLPPASVCFAFVHRFDIEPIEKEHQNDCLLIVASDETGEPPSLAEPCSLIRITLWLPPTGTFNFTTVFRPHPDSRMWLRAVSPQISSTKELRMLTLSEQERSYNCSPLYQAVLHPCTATIDPVSFDDQRIGGHLKADAISKQFEIIQMITAMVLRHAPGDQSKHSSVDSEQLRKASVGVLLGGPGTGKTSQMLDALLYCSDFLKKPNGQQFSAVILAPSNAAANLIGEKLLDQRDNNVHASVFRYGDPGRISERLLTNNRTMVNAFRGTFTELPESSFTEMRHFYHSVTFIVTTLNSLHRGDGWNFIRDKQFDLLVVDEASQATIEQLLLASTILCDSLLLVGDTAQLGPVFRSRLLQTAPSITTVPLVSIEEHLKKSSCSSNSSSNSGKKPQVITQVYTHRLTHRVAQLVNELSYTKRPLLAFPDAQDMLKIAFPTLNRHFGIFHSSKFTEQFNRHSNSYTNEAEAHFTITLIKALCALAGIESYHDKGTGRSSFLRNRPKTASDFTIGVITFYSAQVNLIKSLVKKTFGQFAERISVGTAEVVQGSEFTVAILSTVRGSNHDRIHMGSVGFTNSTTRVNVAISRAPVLFIISQLALFNSESTWKTILQNAESTSDIFSDNGNLTVENVQRWLSMSPLQN